MKNKIFKLTHICFLFFFSINVSASDQFNFDITEVQILDKGNKFVGLNQDEVIKSKIYKFLGFKKYYLPILWKWCFIIFWWLLTKNY